MMALCEREREGRERDRQRRPTDRQTDRHTHTRTYPHTHTHMRTHHSQDFFLKDRKITVDRLFQSENPIAIHCIYVGCNGMILILSANKNLQSVVAYLKRLQRK